jgi:hypothetical protein
MPPQSQTCPTCTHDTLASASYCPRCGTRLAQGAGGGVHDVQLSAAGGLMSGALHLEQLHLRRARAEAEAAELRAARAREAEQVRRELLDADVSRRKYIRAVCWMSFAGFVLLTWAANLSSQDPGFLTILSLSLGIFLAALFPGFMWFVASGRCSRLRTHLSSLREGGA